MNEQRDAPQETNWQYKDSRNLAARIALHERFSTNQYSWQAWVFSQIKIPGNARVLEVGSGPGSIWQENVALLPADCKITLTDISSGMLLEAAQTLVNRGPFRYVTADASQLPFLGHEFDVVIANHMLYHVSSVAEALSEISRVLKPQGCLYAATNGVRHLWEIHSWEKLIIPGTDQGNWGTGTEKFSLENGEALLSQWFEDVQLIPHQDRLLVTEVEPLLRYISSYYRHKLARETRESLQEFLQNKLAETGVIEITKATGLFTAVKH